MKDKLRALALIEAKFELISPHVQNATKRNSRRQMLEFLRANLAKLDPRGLAEIDYNISQLLDEELPAEKVSSVRAEIEGALKAQFGFSRVGADPAVVIARALKRKRLRDEDEARLIRDCLSGDHGGELLSVEKQKELDGLLAAYEMGRGK